MKKTYKYLLVSALVTPMMLSTGCVEETFPTNGATQEQLAASSKATEALLWAMPAYFNKYDMLGNDMAYDWGYGSMMHIRDVMTADYAIVSSTYDWYTSWEQNSYIGQGYMSTQYIWNFYNKQVLTCNNILGAVDLETASDVQKGYYGMGLAFRASTYLDMARMYEFLLNDGTEPISPEGKDVLGLTVPIVTEKTTEEESRNNPRAPHKEMLEFIISDLDQAEEIISLATRSAKTLPDLSVVYGLKARAYMWDENYTQAADYARKAIATGQYTPTTRDQWLSTTSGFNEPISSWMWCFQAVKEDDAVQSGIINWTSWSSNEAEYGYAAAGPFNMIGADLYNKINDRDFRKLSFKAPEGTPLSGQEPVLDAAFAADLPTYSAFKFRPGSGNTADFNVGSATAVPLMRIEEMYLIEAEAVAHTSPTQGKQLLEDFMKTYRYPTYTCRGTSEEDVVDEVFLQKRIEFWGEGLSFFDYKRLNKPVVRAYAGTNFSDATLFNTTTRPAWMNFVIIQSEGTANLAVKEYNNPDPSGCYPTINL